MTFFKNYLISCLMLGSMLGSLALLTACGSPMQTASTDSSSGGGNNGAGTPGGGGTIDPQPFKGFIGSGTYQGRQIVGVDLNKGEVQISIPLGTSLALTLADTPIAQVPGAHIYLTKLDNGTSAVVLGVPLKYVLRTVPNFTQSVLPNGDPLPGITGPLPTTSFNLGGAGNVVAHLYFGSNTLGLFVETSFNPVVGIGVEILNSLNTKLGNFTFIPTKGAFHPGVYMALTLPANLAAILAPVVK